MLATVFRGPFDVRIDQVRDAALYEPTDAVVRIIHAFICGSAPVRAFLPELLADVLAGRLDPSPVLDLTVELDGSAQNHKGHGPALEGHPFDIRLISATVALEQVRSSHL